MHAGLFGGTFNPIHVGHLILAQEALLEGLDEVWLLPNGQPPHKLASPIDPEHRLRMTQLAAEEHSGFQVCRLELDRDGPSYTYETVEKLVGQFPEHRFSFITGADALLNYPWKNFDALMGNLDRFLIAARPGSDPEALAAKIATYPEDQARRIVPFAFPELHISSTAIRERVKRGLPIRYWVPRPVEDYIAEHGLYRETGVGNAG